MVGVLVLAGAGGGAEAGAEFIKIAIMAASHGLEVRSEEGQGPTPLMCPATALLGDTEILATLLTSEASPESPCTQPTVMIGGRSTSPHATAKPSAWICFSRPVPRRTCRAETAKQRWMWQKVKFLPVAPRERPAAPRGPHVGPPRIKCASEQRSFPSPQSGSLQLFDPKSMGRSLVRHAQKAMQHLAPLETLIFNILGLHLFQYFQCGAFISALYNLPRSSGTGWNGYHRKGAVFRGSATRWCFGTG